MYIYIYICVCVCVWCVCVKYTRITYGVTTSIASLEIAIKPDIRPPYCYCIHLENITTTNLHILPQIMNVAHLIWVATASGTVSLETPPSGPPSHCRNWNAPVWGNLRWSNDHVNFTEIDEALSKFKWEKHRQHGESMILFVFFSI